MYGAFISPRRKVFDIPQLSPTEPKTHAGGGGHLYSQQAQEPRKAQTMQDMLSGSPWYIDMVADLHFPRFFRTAIQCEIARRFPRSVGKVVLNFNAKISVFWVGFNLEPRRISSYPILIHNMWAVQILKRGIGKNPCKHKKNFAKI